MLQMAIFGRPGCGKGTQCKLLKKEFKLAHVSSGDLLRMEGTKASDGSPDSQLTVDGSDKMESGKLFDDNYVIDLMKGNVPKTNYILDGFPRSVPQLEVFPINIAIYLNISEKEGEKRALERGKKTNRADDNREAYATRTEEFVAKTMPVINKCKEKGILLEVDGEGKIENVFERIKSGVK